MTNQPARSPSTGSTSRRRAFPRTPIALAVAAALLAPCQLSAQITATTLPSGNNLRSGNATVGLDPNIANKLVIKQTSKSAIIDWTSFSIGALASVDFQITGVTGGLTLNRVTGGSMSEINGSLKSNGTLFLINPYGVLFGAGSTVAVGGLVASTLNITNDDFNAGVASGQFAFTGASTSSIINNGTITTTDFGTAALLASRIENNGTITTPQGTIALVAGGAVTLDIGGDGLTQVVVSSGIYDPNNAHAWNNTGAVLAADGGQVLLSAAGSGVGVAEARNDGLIQARSLQTRAGRVVLASSAEDAFNDVTVAGDIDVSGTAAGVAGGSIQLQGSNVGVLRTFLGTPTTLDASGATDGGTIRVNATNVAAIDNLVTMNANAGANGNGGTISLHGTGLRAFGTFNARGGTNGGNGGLIETSGTGVDTRGIKIDAGAPNGTAGQWLIDPYDVTIVPGAAAGTLPANPFDPVGTTTIQDGDINAALNGGSSVTITTGTGGPAASGDVIFLSGTHIQRTLGTAPVTFRVDANSSILNRGPLTIESTAPGALNLVFDSNANGVNDNDGEIDFDGATFRTNGGSIAMFGRNDATNGFAQSNVSGIALSNSILDTRVGQADGGTGGDISLRGKAGYYGGGTGVSLTVTRLHGSTGNIDIVGVGVAGGNGVYIAGDATPDSEITTTTGNLTVTGIGSSSAFQTDGSRTGTDLAGYALRSTSGRIDVRGHGDVDGQNGGGLGVANDGLVLGDHLTITSTSGEVSVSGSSAGAGAGVAVAGPDQSTAIDSGAGTLVVRAHNAGGADAIVLNGTLTSANVVDLRPGGVDANGNLVENPADGIVLGGTTGFGITQAEFDNITAATLVLGSDIQTGAITVAGPITYTHNLALQAGAGGAIAINGALNVGANTLTLASAGAITQTAAITAGSLLATSTGAAVTLANAGNNVAANTLAGFGATGFGFTNANTVGIGTVNGTGFAAATGTAAPVTTAGVASNGNVLIRALTGDVVLNGNVSGANVDLVSAGIFDNAGGNTIAATGTWRVWADTWVGEARGGVAGSGTLPNLFGCTYGAACASGITVPAADNHFIYFQRPTLTVNLANAIREYGLPNAAITFAVTGLILGDQQANAVTGASSTTATQASDVGTYALTGAFTSPAGYLVNLTPGVLVITPAVLTVTANPLTRSYGDPNGTLGGTVTGFRLTDTLASATTGTLAWTTNATQGSNVGTYAINGTGLTAQNYVFVDAPGNATALAITPATLVFTADPFSRTVGSPNGALGGTLTGFRNGDTAGSATTGTLAWTTPAGQYSPVGSYAINGGGLVATNYTFAQDPGNATALLVLPTPQTYSIEPVRDTPSSYVYDRNFETVAMCPSTDLLASAREQAGDNLTREWSRVRSRPNLANCVTVKLQSGCDSF